LSNVSVSVWDTLSKSVYKGVIYGETPLSSSVLRAKTLC
jgi:hypothetical protein